MLPSSSTPPYIPEMTFATAANSLPTQSSSISSPQFTYGTSVTTFPATRCFSSLSPSFTPFYPQSQQKHLYSASDVEAGTASHEGYDLNQSMDGSHSNYHPYSTHSVDVSGLSNYTDYTGLASDYKFPWTSQGYYGVQSYDPWGSNGGGWQEFSPTSEYLDSSHWGEPSSVEYLYTNACPGEGRPSSYFPSDLLSYPPESALSEDESCTSSPRNRVCLSLPEACASSPPILLSHMQGVFAPSNSALSGKSKLQHGFSRCPQNNKNLKMDISKAKMEEAGTFIQDRQPTLKDGCGKRVSDGSKELDTANKFVFSELMGRNGEGQEHGAKQVSITQEGQFHQIQSPFGLICTIPESVPERFAANSQEEDRLQPKHDQLIQKSNILNLEQGSQEKGERNTCFGQDPPLHVSSVPWHIAAEESTVVSRERSPQCLKAGTERRHCFSVLSGCSSPGGFASGSAKLTLAEHTNAKVSGLSPKETSKSEQKILTIPLTEAKIPNLGKEVIADDDHEAESYKHSYCVLDLSCAEKACLKNGSLSKLVPSMNGCQLLTSSIYNLSSVLATNHFVEYPDGSGHVDSQALEKTICNLSYCLLKQSSDKLMQRCNETGMNGQLIQNSGIPDPVPGLGGKGLWQGAPPHNLIKTSLNAEYSTDATLGSEQMVYQNFESSPAETNQGSTERMGTSSSKSSRPTFADEHFSASSTSGVIGCKSKSTDCSSCSKNIKFNTSCSPAISRSHLDKKVRCKLSCDEDKLNLLNEKNELCEGKTFVDACQNAQTCNESKCYSDSFQDKANFDDGLLPKITESSNCGQLLILSMQNLSRVLLTSQSAEYSDGSEYMDLNAMEKTICYLSHCLLSRSSNNLGSLKPTVCTQSIQKSNIVNAEQEIHGKGATKDASYHASFESGDNFQPNKESTLGSQEMVPKCESISAGIVQAASHRTNTPSIRSSGCFASECLHVPKNVNGVIGCGSTNYVDPKRSGQKASGSSPVAASSLEKNNSCKSFTDEAKIYLAAEMQESCNDGVILNDVWNAQSNGNSKCDLILAHPDKSSLKKVVCVKAVPSLNGCQLLISSMYNLSKVLFSCQNLESPNGFGYMDLDAVECSISMLSDCLLKQSCDIFGKTCHEPIEKIQQNYQEQLHGQKIVRHADVHTRSEDCPYLQESSISDTVYMEPSQSTMNQRMFLPIETVLSACPNGKGPLGTCLEINAKVTSSKRCAEEAAIATKKTHMEKPLDKVFELEDKFLKLQDDIAYERSESNSVLSTYKNLWREAHEALCHSRLEITEINTELEGLKQLLSKHKKSGSSQSDSKGLDPVSTDHGRGVHSLIQEEAPGNTLDCIPHSIHNMEEEQHYSKAKLGSEAHTDFFESWGRGLPKSEEVMTGYFVPVKSTEVDLESAVSFPDTKEVMSRLSLLQARGTFSNNDDEGLPKSEEMMTGYFVPVKSTEVELESAVSFPDTKEVMSRLSLLQTRGTFSNNDDKDEAACNSPIDVDKGLAGRLSLLLGRQSFDLNLSCSENSSANGLSPVIVECLGLASNLLNVCEGIPHDKTLNLFSQLPAGLNSEMLSAESAEQQGFGKVDVRCLDWSPVSTEMQDDISRRCHGSSDGCMQVEGRGNKVLQIESSNFIDVNSDSQYQLKGQSEILQDRELKMNWNTRQQEEREIICLRPTSTENCITCLEGDADWEHVLMSAT